MLQIQKDTIFCKPPVVSFGKLVWNRAARNRNSGNKKTDKCQAIKEMDIYPGDAWYEMLYRREFEMFLEGVE